jgi:hypothetical protein
MIFEKIGKLEKSGEFKVGIVGENEPENMNAMNEKFPSAVSIFVRGAFIKPEALKKKPHYIYNYCNY